MYLILQTHRKYIKLLRDRANLENPVIITKEDLADFQNLFKTTKQSGARHQGLYRITLKALKRPSEEIDSNDIYGRLDNRVINQYEKYLAKLEWRSLGATLKGAYLVPFLRLVFKNGK